MRDKFPLFTAIIVHYNNGDYIYETIRSVLEQDYPNIELIISDDCSPNGFNADGVINFINDHRRENLKRVVLNENSKNMGTVRHLEIVREKAQGEFELAIAADDIWHDDHVFSAFAERFQELGEDAEWIISQVEMCDETLKNTSDLFVKPEIIRMVEAGKYQDLLDQEAHSCLLPGLGAAFRRSFFEKINHLSDDYYLIEDYTTHLRALRMGIPVYYLDIISAKHRHGGISHGNSRNGKILYSRYVRDFLTIFEKEVEPYPERFSEEAYNMGRKKYEYNLNHYQESISGLEWSENQEPIVSYASKVPFAKALLRELKMPLIKLSRKEPVLADARRLIMLFVLAALCRMGDGFVSEQLLVSVFQGAASVLLALLAFRIGVNILLRIWNRTR